MKAVFVEAVEIVVDTRLLNNKYLLPQVQDSVDPADVQLFEAVGLPVQRFSRLFRNLHLNLSKVR